MFVPVNLNCSVSLRLIDVYKEGLKDLELFFCDHFAAQDLITFLLLFFKLFFYPHSDLYWQAVFSTCGSLFCLFSCTRTHTCLHLHEGDMIHIPAILLINGWPKCWRPRAESVAFLSLSVFLWHFEKWCPPSISPPLPCSLSPSTLIPGSIPPVWSSPSPSERTGLCPSWRCRSRLSHVTSGLSSPPCSRYTQRTWTH